MNNIFTNILVGWNEPKSDAFSSSKRELITSGKKEKMVKTGKIILAILWGPLVRSNSFGNLL